MPMMTEREAAAELGICVRTVARLRAKGLLPGISGRPVIYDPADVAAYKASTIELAKAKEREKAEARARSEAFLERWDIMMAAKRVLKARRLKKK